MTADEIIERLEETIKDLADDNYDEEGFAIPSIRAAIAFVEARRGVRVAEGTCDRPCCDGVATTVVAEPDINGFVFESVCDKHARQSNGSRCPNCGALVEE